MTPVFLSPTIYPTPKEETCFEITLIELVSEFINQMKRMTPLQAALMKQTSSAIEDSCQRLLDHTKALLEEQKLSSFTGPLKTTIEVLGSILSIASGTLLCVTGVALAAGSVLLATGVLGLIHTTLQSTGSYEKIANLFQNKAQQEIILNYLPMMISMVLVISSTLSGTYAAMAAKDVISLVIQFFLPLILKSLEMTQVSAKAYFDFRKADIEVKKVDEEALKQLLTEALNDTYEALRANFEAQKTQVKLNEQIIETLLRSKNLF